MSTPLRRLSRAALTTAVTLAALAPAANAATTDTQSAATGATLNLTTSATLTGVDKTVTGGSAAIVNVANASFSPDPNAGIITKRWCIGSASIDWDEADTADT